MDNAITMQMLEERNLNFLESKLIKLEDIFKCNERIVLDDKKLELFLNGVMLKLENKEKRYI